jgi:hypothetical protein
LHNEKLQEFYSSPNSINVTESNHVAHTGEKRNSYRIFEVKPEEQKPSGRHRHK